MACAVVHDETFCAMMSGLNVIAVVPLTCHDRFKQLLRCWDVTELLTYAQSVASHSRRRFMLVYRLVKATASVDESPPWLSQASAHSIAQDKFRRWRVQRG